MTSGGLPNLLPIVLALNVLNVVLWLKLRRLARESVSPEPEDKTGVGRKRC